MSKLYQRAPRILREHPNVVGAVEYLLRNCAANPADCKELFTNVPGTLPQVASITGYVVIEFPKDEHA